jgi:hypothetical protein
MRRKLGLLAVTTWLLLTGAVLTASPAGARNVGGTIPADATCYSPGQAQARSDQANSVLSCFCYVAPAPPSGPKDGERNVGGLLPDMITTCPPGILKQHGVG